MPDFPITITVSTRVADLIKDASDRAQDLLADNPTPPPRLNALDWFIERVREGAVRLARVEYSFQQKEAGDPAFDSIEEEVTA